MALDKTKTSTGYRLGRLLAALETAIGEKDLVKKANDHDKAVTQPAECFTRLVRKANAEGKEIKEIEEIIAGIAEFPAATLSIEDQAEFECGYYHQLADLRK